MQAIRVHEFGAPEVMKLEEVADPRPGPGQVLIRIHAIGVNPVETYMRSGVYPKLPPLPYTPGADAAGVIESVGEGVVQFVPGDRVYTFGTVTGAYAERTLCETSTVRPLPPHSCFADGASLGVAGATAWRALFQRARAVAGETLLVHGATGGVGSAAVQLARAAGMTVVGTGGSDAGLALVSSLGAHLALDHRSPDYLKRALAFTHDRGFDVVLELAADRNLGKDLDLVRMNGRIIVVGSRGPVEINPRLIMSKDASIIAMSLFNASEAELNSVHAGLYAALDNGTLKPVIHGEFPLADAPKAHHEVMNGGSMGKIILTI